MKKHPKKAFRDLLDIIGEYDIITIPYAEKLEALDEGDAYIPEKKIYRLDEDKADKIKTTIHEILHIYYYQRNRKRWNKEKKIEKETQEIYKFLFGNGR